MPAKDDDASLKRLGGGRWQTRDERFTIEPQSGTWAVVDAEQTDDLGLPLVRGPYRSLTAAKEAIGEARTTDPPVSPLASKASGRPSGERPTADRPRSGSQRASATTEAAPRDARRAAADAAPARTKAGKSEAKGEEEPEPRWIGDLEPDDRRRARRLIEALAAAGHADPVALVKRDVVGEVPAIAGHVLARRVAALVERTGRDAEPQDLAADLVDLLAEGADRDLDVRWRLVDGDDRPITLTARDLERARKETSDG